MPKITFIGPQDTKICDVSYGKNLLDAALEHNIDLDHACGGYCACCTCRVTVQKGLDTLAEQSSDELDRLSEEGCIDPNMRLACQTQVFGDLEVSF